LEQPDEAECHAGPVGETGVFLQKAPEAFEKNREEDGRKKDEKNLGRVPKQDGACDDRNDSEANFKALPKRRIGAIQGKGRKILFLTVKVAHQVENEQDHKHET